MTAMRFIYVITGLMILQSCQRMNETRPSKLTEVQLMSHKKCQRPFVFFDLGETLVATKFATDPKTGKQDIVDVRYLNGAYDYLNLLLDHSVRIGALINVPETWGKTNDEKFQYLKSYIQDRWHDPDFGEGLDWNLFEQDLIFLPPKTADRKPAPLLFNEAMDVATKDGCTPIYQGEESPDVNSAEKAGMVAHFVSRDSTNSPVYMPLEKILGSQGELN